MFKKMKKLISVIIALVVILIVVLLVALFSLGTTVKIAGEQIVGKLTKCETHIGDASINALTGHVILKDVNIKNPKADTEGKETNFTNEDFFKLGNFEVDLSMSSLLSDEIHVTKVYIAGPEVTFEKTPLSDSNLSIIMDNVNKFMPKKGEKEEEKEPEKEEPEDKEAKKFVIDDLLIKDVKVNVSSMGMTAPLVIPEIKLQNLGKPGEGITAAEAIKITFTSLFTSIFEGVKNLGGAGNDMGKSAGEAIKDGGKALKEGGKALLDNIMKK